MTDPRSLLADARQRLEGTTAGPWEARPEDQGFAEPEEPVAYDLRTPTGCVFTVDHGDYMALNEANARFIAASRSLVPALCEALEDALTKLEAIAHERDVLLCRVTPGRCTCGAHISYTMSDEGTAKGAP